MDLFTFLLSKKTGGGQPSSGGIKSTKLYTQSFEFDELVSTEETPTPGDPSETVVDYDFFNGNDKHRFYIVFLYREPQEGDNFTEPTTWGGFSMSCVMRNMAGKLYSNSSMITRGTAPLNFEYDTVGNGSNPFMYTSYGVNIVQRGGHTQLTINRKCHATQMKYIPGGTYTVDIYGIDSI